MAAGDLYRDFKSLAFKTVQTNPPMRFVKGGVKG